MKWEKWYGVFVAAIACYLCFMGNNLLLVTDPIESNYALTVKEMILSGDYISPRIFGNYWYDKPIFFYWELIWSFSLFGMTEFAARFPSAVFGVIGAVLCYWFAARIYDKRTGFTAALIMITSVEYFYISKAVITDMTLFVFFSGSLICFYLAYKENKPRLYYGAYGCAALAVLTKGPVGLLLPGLIGIVFLIWQRDVRALRKVKMCSGMVLFFLLAGSWYIMMYALHDGAFISQFIGVHNILRAFVSEHPEHNVWYYYIIIFFAGSFPWTLALPILCRQYNLSETIRRMLHARNVSCLTANVSMNEKFLIVWTMTVIIFYQCVATKYMTYTFPSLMPISIGIAACMKRYFRIVMGSVCLMIIGYTMITFLAAIPMCRNASAWDAAQAVKEADDGSASVVTFGGRYPVSLTYYSDHTAYRLKWAKEIPDLLPGKIDWNAKNVMPFMAIEDIPRHKPVLAVVHEKEEEKFMATVPGTWEKIRTCRQWNIYKKAADE